MAVSVLKMMHKKGEAHEEMCIWKILERERTWSSCWGRPELVLVLGAFVCLFLKGKVKINFQKSFLG